MTWRHRGALAVGLAALVLLAGCATQLGQVRTDNAMYTAGYADDAVTWQTAGGVTTVDATADPKAPHTPLDSQAQAVAKAVWDNLAGRFDRLTVTIRGVGTLTFTHDQLVALFGPRPKTLDQESLSSGAAGDGSVLGLVGVGALFFVGCVVVYSLTRYRRLPRPDRRLPNGAPHDDHPPGAVGSGRGPRRLGGRTGTAAAGARPAPSPAHDPCVAGRSARCPGAPPADPPGGTTPGGTPARHSPSPGPLGPPGSVACYHRAPPRADPGPAPHLPCGTDD